MGCHFVNQPEDQGKRCLWIATPMRGATSATVATRPTSGTVAATSVPPLSAAPLLGVPAPGNGTATVAVDVSESGSTAALTPVPSVAGSSAATVRLRVPVLVLSSVLPE